MKSPFGSQARKSGQRTRVHTGRKRIGTRAVGHENDDTRAGSVSVARQVAGRHAGK
jgi:hypothetical protein